MKSWKSDLIMLGIPFVFRLIKSIITSKHPEIKFPGPRSEREVHTCKTYTREEHDRLVKGGRIFSTDDPAKLPSVPTVGTDD